MSARSDAKFETERTKVTTLFGRLGQAVDRYEDPNGTRGAAGESGADVVAVSGGHRVGVQVTDLDTGKTPGSARAAESKLAHEAAMQGGTYFTWAQNDPCKVFDAIVHSVSRKAKMSFSGFDEFWLLICCGVPTLGAIGSTFVMTPWIEAGTLDAATLPVLEKSKYTQAFIHTILGVEDEALFQWRRGGSWSKLVRSAQSQEQDHHLWESIRNWSGPRS